MGIKIGDIDVAKELIELHYQLFRTQKIVDILLGANPQSAAIVAAKMKEIDDEAVRRLQLKFPNMGIQKTEKATSNTTI